MEQFVFEGTWEEIAIHAPQLTGRRVKVITVDAEQVNPIACYPFTRRVRITASGGAALRSANRSNGGILAAEGSQIGGAIDSGADKRMTRRIDIDPVADSDMDAVFVYLAAQSLNAGPRFLRACRSTFERLADMPGIGALRQYRNPQLSGLRMLPIAGFENYLVFYLTTEESILIVRVLHGARDISRIFERGE